MASVAVIGAGYWGKNLVRNFAELGALSAVVERDERLSAEVTAKFGASPLSFEAVLGSENITAVAIASPAETHAHLALRALAAGKHVFVEKPLALTSYDVLALNAAASRTNRILMVGHLIRHHPAFKALEAAATSGAIGRLLYAYSNRLSLGKFRIEENALWSLAPHDVSLLTALFGEPRSVSAWGCAWVTPRVEDAFRVNIGFAENKHAHVFASWLHPYKEHRLVVVGSTGALVFEDSIQGPNKLMIYPHVLDISNNVPEPTKGAARALTFGDGEPLKLECMHFLQCIAEGVQPITDGLDGLRVVRVLEAAQQSSKHGGISISIS